MSVQTITPADAAPTSRRLRIDFLFLDLETCTRCRGTGSSLAAALAEVAAVLRAADVQVAINKVHVTSADQARELRFVSSPTLRVDGSDIALELRESPCGSEACTDGCGEHIACRVWVHRGQQYTEPPSAMIVDAILRSVYGAAPPPRPAQPYTLPENLRRFFAGRSASTRQVRSLPVPGADAEACCGAAELQFCCGPADKAECCGAATDRGCGCR
jgi:hypothetical protein